MTKKLRKYTIAALGSFCMLFALTGTGLAATGNHTHPEIQKYNQGITLMEQSGNQAASPNGPDYSKIDGYRFSQMPLDMLENSSSTYNNDSLNPDEWPDSCFSKVSNLPPQYRNSAYF